MVVVDAYIPIIDLAAALAGDAVARADTGAAIDQACRNSGFLVVSGHGIDPELVDRVHSVTAELFAQADEWKQQWDSPTESMALRGFIRTPSYVAASEGLATAPDMCEMFTISRLGEPGIAEQAGLGDAIGRWGAPNLWPDRPAALRETWLAYYAAMEHLAAELMRLFALGLGVDEHHFDALIDQHITSLTANFYPAVDGEPGPDQFRKGPHSDWGTLTILYQDGTGGLEVVDHRVGGWVDVPVLPGTFVVNIGDLMARWTNDVWRSTKHRVRVPPADRRSVGRVSIPFFHHPNWGAPIECLPSCVNADRPARYPPIAAGPYLDEKVEAVFVR